MGLDSVELLIDVEKYFDISIANNEAEKIYTIQDFADCVFGKVVIHPTSEDKSQILYGRFRAFFVDRFSLKSDDVIAQSIIKDLIPVQKLKETWADLEKELAIALPPLSE